MFTVTGGLPTRLVYLLQIIAGNEKLPACRQCGNKSCTSGMDPGTVLSMFGLEFAGLFRPGSSSLNCFSRSLLRKLYEEVETILKYILGSRGDILRGEGRRAASTPGKIIISKISIRKIKNYHSLPK